MKAVAIIFARGGSKGLPGKNVRSLGGKPLIAWSIENAFAIKRIHQGIRDFHNGWAARFHQ